MKIAIVHLENIFKILGTTEPFYVVKHLSENNRLFLFIPRDKEVNTVWNRNGCLIRYLSSERTRIRWRTLIYNLLLLPFVLFSHLRNRFDIIYTYNRIILPGIMLKYIFGVKWACDFRVSPLGQARETQNILGKPYITTRLFYSFLDSLNKFFLNKADLVVVISEEIGKELADVYNVKQGRIYQLPLGVDLEIFNLKNVDSVNSFDNDISMIYVGTIMPYRGLDIVVKALARVLKEKNNIVFKVVGNGNIKDIEALKRLAEGLGIGNRIQWIGEIPHHEVAGKIAESAIALSPLPDIGFFRVSSPAKVFEYLALNKVVLASDILAHRKIIKHRKNGILIEPDNDKKWADAIIEVMNNEELRHSLEDESRKSVEANDWKIMINRLEEKLNELCNMT